MATDKDSQDSAASWVTVKSGVSRTHAPKVIQALLVWLKARQQALTIVRRDAKSCATVVLEFDGERLVLGGPAEWPETLQQVRVLFTDEDQLWNQFEVNIIGAGDGVLTTEIPSEIRRLQRRTNYRVTAPFASSGVLTHGDEKCKGFEIRDISLQGALLVSKRKFALFEGDAVSKITLRFPDTGESDGALINIRSGEIRRAFCGTRGEHYYGIQFKLSASEEESLLQYIRQRERELLRKDVD